VRGAIEDLARGALDLLWPRSCHGCGATLGGTRERWLCRPCRAALPLFGEGDTLCARCAAPLGAGTAAGGCADCRRLRPRFEAVRAAGAYRATLRRLVVGMKYARLRDRAWPLGELMADRLRGWGPLDGGAVVVPFPTTAAARRRRGFDPPALLADEVAARLGLAVAAGVLERRGEPPPQASLARAARLRAPKGTVRVSRPGAVRGRTVLLVDDVLTTGATADAAARALLGAGAARVLVAVAARA
jgi:predicted amidophosphoribosyltransferase